MSNNNTIQTKSNFQDLPEIPVNQKLSSGEVNQITDFQKVPVQKLTAFVDTDIIVDGTKEYSTTKVIPGATHTITASDDDAIADTLSSEHKQGNELRVLYQFDVDCTLTLVNFESTGNNTGTITPIPSGSYNFKFQANARGVNLVIPQNAVGTSEQGQSVAFSESIKAYNPPGYFDDHTQAGSLNFAKDASVVDNEGYGNGVHGVIITNGDSINLSSDFDVNQFSAQNGERYFFTALWRGLKFSANFTKVVATEVQQVLDRMSNLSGQETAAITDYVSSEIADGNWDLLDEFYCFALNSTDWLTGFKTKTATNNSATRTANGALLAGAEWIDSEFNPIVDGVNYLQDSAIMGAFVYDDTSSSPYSVYSGYDAGSGPRSQLTLSAGNIFFDNNYNAGANSGAGSIANKTLNVIDRSTNALNTRYVDGSSSGTNTHASSLRPNVNIGIGAQNQANPTAQTFFFEGVISTWQVGGSVGFNHVTHNTNVRQLLTDLGITL